MKRIGIMTAAMLLTGAAAHCAAPYVIKTHDFMEMKVSGPLRVDYVQNPDSAGMVVVESVSDERIPWVEAKCTHMKLDLKLSIPETVEAVPSGLPRVRVYSEFLSKVENQGDSLVRILSANNVPTFSAKIMGNGRISVRGIHAGKVTGKVMMGNGLLVLYGDTPEVSLSVTGAGVIEADGLKCRTASVWNTGTGSVGVTASEKLTVKGAGSGTVYYRGTPEIVSKSVGVKIQPIE